MTSNGVGDFVDLDMYAIGSLESDTQKGRVIKKKNLTALGDRLECLKSVDQRGLQIEVFRSGETVDGIRVECECGCVSEVKFEYEEE